ncbi:MAG TPA: TolC family protein, partial [Thermoanaerobaculia bacterium]|nr:TolC family protein [Thermoanaerobaculia bacterium]
MVIKRFLCTLFLSAALASAALAAEAPLALGEAMARARGEAREVAAAVSRRDAADARSRQARGFRLPTVRLSESWIRTDSPAEAFAFVLNQERFSFADFVAGDPNDPDALDSAISRVELELPIWTGGEISTRIEQARLVAEASGDAAARAGDAAALAAGEAWLDLARAREQVALL